MDNKTPTMTDEITELLDLAGADAAFKEEVIASVSAAEIGIGKSTAKLMALQKSNGSDVDIHALQEKIESDMTMFTDSYQQLRSGIVKHIPEN